MHKDYYKVQEDLIKNKIYQENLAIHSKILGILEWSNRSNWFDQITPLIKEVDMINRKSRFSEDDGTDFYTSDWFTFIPEELDINYPWKFNIGDIVTDGNDIMVVIHLPDIHPQNIDYNQLRVIDYGNKYWIIRLDENGNNKDKDDPVYYLHNSFNENQLQKVDEITSNYWKQKIKNKNLY